MRMPQEHVAIVGYGNVAERFYAAAVDTRPGWQIAAVVEPNAIRREAARHTHTGSAVVASLDGLSAEPGLALNLTPAPMHATITAALLERGWHVYTEKPAAPSTAQWMELTRTAAERGLALIAAPVTAYGRTAQRLATLLHNKTLGEPISCHIEVMLGGPAARGTIDAERAWFLQSGVGVAADIGLYGMAFAVRLFGPPERAHWQPSAARQRAALLKDGKVVGEARATAPDAWTACMRWPDGFAGTMHIAYLPGREPATAITIHGSRQSVRADLEDVDGALTLDPGCAAPADPAAQRSEAGALRKYEIALDVIERGLVDTDFLREHWQLVADVLALAAEPMAFHD